MRKTTLLLLVVLFGATSLSAATGWYNDFLSIKIDGAGTVNNYYLSDSNPASGAISLNGTNFGTITSLEITGCDMKYWSDTQDRTGGAFYYKITSSDGLTDIVAPVETIWDQAALGGNDFQGTKTTSINITNALLANGTYKLHVWAKSWSAEGGQGDSWFSNGAANYVATFTISRPVIVTGANGIADNTSYSTLKAAFDAINAQSDQTGKNIEIQIAASTTETATAALNQPATASWNSLTIYPTSENVSISGIVSTTLIDLYGADKVTIIGKLNKTGTAKMLSITNTGSGSDIRFIADATNNKISYCKLATTNIAGAGGVVFFSTAGVTGNDNNTIEYNDINAQGSANGIYSLGTATFENSNNSITNNNIFDFYISNTSATATYGIRVHTNNSDWTISNNSLYQTTSRAYGAAATFHYGISVESGNNNLISGNYIGGSAANAGGTPWTVTGGFGRPVGLYTSVGTTSASSIQNNTIANYDITTDFVTNGSSAFIGYWHAAGSVNVGTVTGNTIGSTTATGSIVVKSNGVYNSVAGPLLVGMNIVTAASVSQVFSNNKIGGIIFDLSNGNRGHLYAVSASGAGALTITNNIFGSETVANSIEHKGSNYAGQMNLRAITAGNSLALTCNNNIIANLTVTSTGLSTLNGVYHNGAGSNSSFNGNVIRDLKTYSTRTSTGSTAAIVGLLFAGNSNTNSFSNNTIYNLTNADLNVAAEAYGIFYETINATGSTIENNKIYKITSLSSNTNSNIIGLYISNGLTTTKNNMISLGSGLTTAYNICGIRKSNTKNNSFYHNSVLISGNEIGVAGTTNTYAFYKTGSGTDELKNNVFINNRSNATGNTQKHYGIYLNDVTTLTSDYNVFNTGGTGGILGAVGTTDYTDPNVWVSTTGLDSHSKVSTVNFTDVTLGDLSISGVSIKDEILKVPSLATVTTDILGTIRNTKYTYAGAHEAALPFIFKAMQGTFSVGGVANSDFATLSDAIKSMNDAITVGGDITFEINSDITEAANFGLAKDMGTNKLTIRPNANADRTITFTQIAANVGPYGHFVIGCATGNLNTALSDATVVSTGNVTIDGYAVGGNVRRLTFTTPTDALSGSALINIVASNATTIKNMIFNNKSNGTSPMSIYINQFKGVTKDLSPMGTVITNNQITSNTPTQSGYGIRCSRSGTATTKITGLEITNNQITASGECVEIYYCNGVNISGNEFKVQKGTTSGSGICVWLRGSAGDMNVIGNKFTEVSSIQTGTSTYATQGILTGATSTNPFNVNIFNNTFAGMNRSVLGSTAINQSYIAEIGYGTTKIYHNSFYLPALNEPNQNGAYNAISFTTANYKADIQNNIFISNDDARSVLISKAVTTGAMNNNIYFLHAGNTKAKIVDTYSTLPAFQLANPTLDVNSKSVDVEFASAATGDLRIAGLSAQDVNLKVPSLAAVTTDILGTTRNTEFTYAGAHEATFPFIPTSTIQPNVGERIIRTKTGIEVILDKQSSVELYNVNGMLMDKSIVNGNYNHTLKNGVYIVRINGIATKFVK